MVIKSSDYFSVHAHELNKDVAGFGLVTDEFGKAEIGSQLNPLTQELKLDTTLKYYALPFTPSASVSVASIFAKAQTYGLPNNSNTTDIDLWICPDLAGSPDTSTPIASGSGTVYAYPSNIVPSSLSGSLSLSASTLYWFVIKYKTPVVADSQNYVSIFAGDALAQFAGSKISSNSGVSWSALSPDYSMYFGINPSGTDKIRESISTIAENGLYATLDSIGISDGGVTTAKIADLAVTTDKIADYSVTAIKLATGVGSTGIQGATGVQGETGIAGIDGVTGIAGIDGVTGVQGVQGDTGVQGVQGDTGVAGETGVQGDTGVQGVQGVQGDTGVQGVQGDTGVQGVQGDTGVAGETGVQGVQGDTGVQGVQGDTGVQGVQGDTGVAGETGVQGVQGDTGVQGVQGDTGIAGVDGVTGVAGETGVQGVQGDTGVQGVQGDTGVQGVTGLGGFIPASINETNAAGGASPITLQPNMLYILDLAAAAPSTDYTFTVADLGVGDKLMVDVINNAANGARAVFATTTSQTIRYNNASGTSIKLIDSETWIGLVWDTANSYVVAYDAKVPVTGLQGETGPYGQTGVQGVQGDTGVQGVQGDTGVAGETGVQGVQGDTGVQGVQGDTGVQGVQGDTGVQGVQGDTGVAGETGVQGVQGDTGVQGVQGDTGVQGVQGDTGVQGVQGDTGVQGVQGDTGVQGVQGDTGVAGETGVQGVQGDTDVQGVQGDTGVQGVQGDTGVAGETGVQGVQGDTGVQGVQGDTGIAGIDGVTGVAGETGVQGIFGDTGVQGSTGVQGVGFDNWMLKTANYTTVNRDKVACDTSGGSFTATLPASPSAGDWVMVADVGGAMVTNNLTVDRNGNNIAGLASDFTLDVDHSMITFIYFSGNWAPVK